LIESVFSLCLMLYPYSLLFNCYIYGPFGNFVSYKFCTILKGLKTELLFGYLFRLSDAFLLPRDTIWIFVQKWKNSFCSSNAVYSLSVDCCWSIFRVMDANANGEYSNRYELNWIIFVFIFIPTLSKFIHRHAYSFEWISTIHEYSWITIFYNNLKTGKNYCWIDFKFRFMLRFSSNKFSTSIL